MRWMLLTVMIWWMLGWTMDAAWSSVISCGATLGPDAAYVLPADLTCPEPNPVLTLLRDTSLDLAGHALVAAGGVQLYGDRITVRHGVIADCSAAGWCLFTYDEGHLYTLQDLVLARGADITGDLMTVTHVWAGDPGLRLDGLHHRVDQVEAVAMEGYIRLGRDSSRVTRMRAQCSVTPLPSPFFPEGYTEFPCVLLDGERNLILDLTIRGGGIGFSVDGERNLLLRVTVTETVHIDVKESIVWPPPPGACSPNLWLFNRLETASPPCLLDWPHTFGGATGLGRSLDTNHVRRGSFSLHRASTLPYPTAHIRLTVRPMGLPIQSVWSSPWVIHNGAHHLAPHNPRFASRASRSNWRNCSKNLNGNRVYANPYPYRIISAFTKVPLSR